MKKTSPNRAHNENLPMSQDSETAFLWAGLKSSTGERRETFHKQQGRKTEQRHHRISRPRGG
jgi:hypothetical protein